MQPADDAARTDTTHSAQHDNTTAHHDRTTAHHDRANEHHAGATDPHDGADDAQRSMHRGAVRATANDRMKQRSAAWLPESIVVAVVLHACLFAFAPDFTVAEDYDVDSGELYVIPPTVELPEPPEMIARPAEPVPGSLDIDMDVTIPSTSMETWQSRLPAPPASVATDELSDYDRLVPAMLAPRLLNPDEVEAELRRAYPAMLRDAGIGGTAHVNLWLDENGRVVKAEISQSSGYDALDEAAMKVVSAMRLTPAENRGRAVRVIATIPVVFRVQ